MAWSRRAVTAALGPALLSACATPRPLVSVNLLDSGAAQAQPEGGGARLETAFDEARRMTVPVFVEGKGPFPFVVDTGANRSVVSRELAAECGLPSAGQASVHGIAGVEPADLAVVRRLRVGGVISRDLEMPALPRSRLGAAGLLGVDVFHRRRVLLNFAENRFEIADSRAGASVGRDRASRIASPNEPVRVPAQYRFGQLVILDAEVGDVRVSAFLDSGSQVTIGNRALRDATIRARPEFGVRLAPVPLISATGQTAMGQYATLPSLRLGGLEVTQALGIFAELHIFDLWKLSEAPAILIGVDVLRHFREITLDFARREVMFLPPRQARVRGAG